MIPGQTLRVPETVTSEKQLDEWIEKQLEKLGDDAPIYKEVQLQRAIYRCVKTNRDAWVLPKTFDYYKNQYVSFLMDIGWNIKRDVNELNQEAIPVFEEALRIEPQNPLANYRLGHLMNAEREIGKAIVYFSTALELSINPDKTITKLSLNLAQLENAIGMAMALLSEVSDALPSTNHIPTLPIQINALRNLLIKTWRNFVIYNVHNGDISLPERYITNNEYSTLMVKLMSDSEAIVLDRFADTTTLRYMDEPTTVEGNMLRYLLIALGIEQDQAYLERPNTRSQNVSRLNNVLRTLGVDDKMRFSFSRDMGISVESSISVHYFKSLLQ